MRTLDIPQRSEAWFAARRGIPTASRFDAILQPVKGEPSKAQETLINELIAESLCPPEQGEVRFSTDEMEQGMRLEAEARCWYELEHATAPVTEAGFILHDSGLFGCSPDALVGEDGGLELKCPNAATHVGYVRAGVLPNDYKLQVHGSIVVTGRSWWDFASYARNIPPFVVRVHRDAFTAKLEAELFAFCKRYNEARARFGLSPIGTQKQAA
jgi:hypothetical protein